MTNEEISYGAATRYPLDELSPLTQARGIDAWGMERPRATQGLLRLSAELAATAYTMEVTPWLRAGWRDVTIQVDGDLTDGFAACNEAKTPLERLAAAWKLHKVRAKIRGRNPIGQMLGTVRQMKGSDTGKAVVMLHPVPDGRYVVAIGFMGTGGRIYDWISNFRMNAEGGLHKGFLQLCRQFEGNEAAITFPETAKELGLERLTLEDILQECRHENSRFLLWTAGHSQGAAVMQVWTHCKLKEDGVLPCNLLGCGFASPSVATGTAVRSAAAYPLLHVVNSDDPVPRSGAMVHLGELLIYRSCEEQRRRCYAIPEDGESAFRRMTVRPIVDSMRDMPACLTTMAAYLRLLGESPVEEVLGGLSWMESDKRLVRKMVELADDKADSLLRHLYRKCLYAYETITGVPMSMRRVALMQQRLERAAHKIGVRALWSTMLSLAGGPHCMIPKNGAEMGSYPYITLYGAEMLEEARWLCGQRPALIRASGETPLLCLRRERVARRRPRVPHRQMMRQRCR